MIIDIIIDKLTDCLEERATGKTFETTTSPEKVSEDEAKTLKAKGWKFDWADKDLDEYEICKLYIKGDSELQGIIAFRELHDPDARYVEVGLVESAPHNVGKRGTYEGVGPHLFAIACKRSIDCGFEGFVSFTAKTGLIQHYKESIFANQVGSSSIMIIYPEGSRELVKHYYKEV